MCEAAAFESCVILAGLLIDVVEILKNQSDESLLINKVTPFKLVEWMGLPFREKGWTYIQSLKSSSWRD